jgi:hypothetical protein
MLETTLPPASEEPAQDRSESVPVVPASLRTWFRVHAAIDVLAALPLLLFPARALGLLGWTTIDPVATRLCGAALMGIGVASLTVDRHGLAGYRTLLSLKVVWSAAAVFALFAGIGDGAPPAAWAFLSIFIAFSGVWMSYTIRLRQLARVGQMSSAGAADDDDDTAGEGEDPDAQDDAAPRVS